MGGKSKLAKSGKVKGETNMPIHKEFAELHREMEMLIEWKDRGKTWASPEQRAASEMVVRILWTLANNREVSKVGLEFLQEEMAKLGPA